MISFEWMEFALCKDFPDTDERKLWFPDDPDEFPDEARALCARCPVQEQCLKAKLKEEGAAKPSRRHGNYGGMNPLERYRFIRSGSTELKKSGPKPDISSPNAEQNKRKATKRTVVFDKPPTRARWSEVEGEVQTFNYAGEKWQMQKWAATWKADNGKLVQYEEWRRLPGQIA